jgi:hypothetical protein
MAGGFLLGFGRWIDGWRVFVGFWAVDRWLAGCCWVSGGGFTTGFQENSLQESSNDLNFQRSHEAGNDLFLVKIFHTNIS